MYSSDMVKLIKEIQAVDFAVYDLSLFLDTHPNNQRALEDKNQLVRRSKQLKANYEEKFGPLSLKSISQLPYRYIDDPWPWEIHY